MSVAKYGVFRASAAAAGFNWVGDVIHASIVSDEYAPSLDVDDDISLVGDPISTIVVSGKVVDDIGWLKHDQIYYPPFYTTEPFSQIVYWRFADGMPLILATFPTIQPILSSGTPRPFALLLGGGAPGITRL